MRAATEFRRVWAGVATCGLLALGTSAAHGAVIKVQLGEVGPDVGMSPAGVFGTINDGNVGTTGDQNTAVEFTGGLAFVPDIAANVGSFSLGNVQAVGPALVVGPVALQGFSGGTFELYDPANTLLLSGTLTSSMLTGSLGAPGTGSLFTTSLATVTGGTLSPLLVPGSLSLSLEMTNINGGAGLVVAAGAPILLPFVGDATLSIHATLIPEPAGLAVLGVCAVAMGGRRRAPFAR